MVRVNEQTGICLEQLGVPHFEERFPWIGGDLQTLRDTFISEELEQEKGKQILVPIPENHSRKCGAGNLLCLLDEPISSKKILGLVLILHGLGGSSRRQGLRRMASSFLDSGFAVLRVNLRGADPGREFAAGTYSAKCNSDLFPVISHAREICDSLAEDLPSRKSLPLYGVGLSLGGTILLNTCLDPANSNSPCLDGLVCISSPLDLSACSESIERRRNTVYQRWLLWRLVRQTLADPFGISDEERSLLLGVDINKTKKISSIRAFDSAITAPRWGFKNVEEYYKLASPLKYLLDNHTMIPKSLFIQSFDDPWVPVYGAQILMERVKQLGQRKIDILLTKKGGHNGFHGLKGCWGDYLVNKWLLKNSV
ncbi:alpha/beta fold hydrolase [Prochlorococcus sp. MIT 1223]|uniref:alpha/beta fold hydrolase n=1 Tax=Prochlorococcus sp. MIT 1223 TaxID=3096217 RepID=UPI002A74CD25|nr:alpha/beta fold hydrolase [Prochlorococcus sp. MIT 1223]